jgi:hypothetical protein
MLEARIGYVFEIQVIVQKIKECFKAWLLIQCKCLRATEEGPENTATGDRQIVEGFGP